MKINVPLRLDIAGSYTDLPGYREKGGMHIATPLDYYVRFYSHPLNTLAFQPIDGNFFVREMNYRVAWWFRNNYPQTLITHCDLQHGAGLGGSSAAVVGLVKWYTQYSGRSMTPHQVAECACQVIEQTSICGRQDEFCSAFASPLYLYYNNQTQVQAFEWPEEFRRNIEGWNLLYIPRTTSCQDMLEYEMNANLDMEPIVYFTKLMYKAIQKADWNNFWKWYVAHWKFVEEQNPRKINDEIRELRKKYNGIYIRPCGAGAGGYLLVHGEITGENIYKIKLLV